jgi:large subunit ribosomal protein L21
MKYAVIETGGKQYRVTAGDTIFVEKLPVEAEDAITFDKVLAIYDDDSSTFGTPYVEGAKVTATVVKNGKSKKVIVYKMRPKKNYRRKQGHRQPYTKVQINEIA